MLDVVTRTLSDEELIAARAGGPLEQYGAQRHGLPPRERPGMPDVRRSLALPSAEERAARVKRSERERAAVKAARQRDYYQRNREQLLVKARAKDRARRQAAAQRETGRPGLLQSVGDASW